MKNNDNILSDLSNKYLIACDIDGTLLNNDGVLSKQTIEYIKKISNHGHLVCLITGRPYDGSIEIYRELDLKTILVNQNGSFMSKPDDPSYIPIAIGFSKHLLKLLLENKVLKKLMQNVLIEGMGICWLWKKPTNSQVEEEMKEIYHLKGRKVSVIDEDFSKITTDISNMIFQIPDECDLDQIIYEIKSVSPTLIARNWTLPTSGSKVIEVCTKFATKQTAVKYLQSYYGIPNERCVAFGDGDNDVEMLAKTTWSFALKNASPAARLAARYMTKYDNNNNGVIKEMKKFFNI